MVKQLKHQIQLRIISLSKQNLSQREIARRLQISQSVVSKKLKKHSSGILPVKQGRPKVLDKLEERYIARLALSGKATKARDISQNLREYSHTEVSQNTILRSLKSNGIKSHLKIKKPLLKKEHRKKRRNFEKTHRKWDCYDWEDIVWSDETKICLHTND